MKKKMIRITAVLCALACMLVALPACDRGQKIDATKTQLYVGNYEGGMGSRWLDEYKKGFEEKYKDYVNGDKVGVEVIIMNDKITYAASSLENSIEKSSVNVFFTELLDYYAFAEKGLLYDISDAVTGQIDGESKSIEDKLSADQKSYYTSYDGKYYGLPHYRTLRGITYDIDLFNAKKLYIKADGTSVGTNNFSGKPSWTPVAGEWYTVAIKIDKVALSTSGNDKQTITEWKENAYISISLHSGAKQAYYISHCAIVTEAEFTAFTTK